ncbi:MAG: glycoside hydrolase family 127 protein [Planctomycetes bacterium]|nr:glycoside hydrolase family 127 protein [Planctomycetota bacterium]
MSTVATPPIEPGSPHYAASRAPLRPNPLVKLPIRAIEPRGWLRKQLELQAKGFHGHLGELSRFLKKEGSAWLDPQGKGTHGWEEPVYWLKGFSNAAYVLRDEALIAETKTWIEGILRSRKPDGWFGPDEGRTGEATDLKGRDDLWPNMIALFCLQDWHDFTGDSRVLELMTRYFRYLEGVPEDRFLVGYWPKMRGGDLLSSVYWLHDRTGEPWLLALAEKVHRRTADWTADVINWHNVNMSQGFGEPTTFWPQSKDERHLKASYRNYDKIRDLYGQVPGGMFGGDENCRPGYSDPRQAVETCGMIEMMLSTERLLWITGDLLWADRCEDVAFNSLPAALTADMKALRYLTSPNMPLSDSRSKSPGLQNGGPMLHMNPHDHRCCQHNWGHGWPYYAEHLWFATRDRGLAAVLYAASKVTAKVADSVEVAIEEDTRYPFEETVELRLRAPRTARFPLYLRVPGWCQAPKVSVNGRDLAVEAAPLRYIKLEREWTDGDKVALTLPMRVALRRWEKQKGSVSVDRGPLTYSLEIGESYVRKGGTDAWPAWEIHPTTPWSYGLVLDPADPARSFEVVRRPWPASDMPFTHEGTPVALTAKGKKIPEWQLDELGLVGLLQESPARSDEAAETIRLIPMGAARLRISSFPVIGDGPGAKRWKAPPRPAYRATASHCFANDSERAVADGVEPRSSGDGDIPRFTWWDRKGTTEWIQAELERPRKVSKVAVYWFDDTGRGGCRVPASWRLLYRRGAAWHEVERPSDYGVEKDRYNETAFAEVETDALRIEARLRPDFSGGILEWRIEGVEAGR